MNYILRKFEESTNWNSDSCYENVTATCDNLLQLEIPSSLNIQISNQSTPYTFTTFELSNYNVINGSLSYLYTDCDNMKKLVHASSEIPLHSIIETFRFINPYHLSHKYSREPPCNSDFVKHTLMYGRMYYPGSILEAMYCKRLSPSSELVLKGFSWMNKPSFFIMYWKHYTGSTFQELIFSTNESLLGYRILHNSIHCSSKMNTYLYNNSILSFGAELWLGIGNMLPGCSTTLRYFTHLADTCKPITLTLSLNPLFGHISSSYSIKPTPSSTFCTKYDFNIYSIESDLSFGCELWKRKTTKLEQGQIHKTNDFINANTDDNFSTPFSKSSKKIPNIQEKQMQCISNDQEQKTILDEMNTASSSQYKRIWKERTQFDNFAKMVNNAQFTSVLKLSSSVRNKTLKLLWEGKYKGILVSAGAELTTMPLDTPNTINKDSGTGLPRPMWLRPAKFGIKLQYST